MQWLFEGSEEAPALAGLGLFDGRCSLMPPAAGIKIPHVGWNTVEPIGSSRVFPSEPTYFYFVHSYYPDPEDRDVVIGETDYGVTFASVLARDNVVATQFHPEKSGDIGLRFYRNFLHNVFGE